MQCEIPQHLSASLQTTIIGLARPHAQPHDDRRELNKHDRQTRVSICCSSLTSLVAVSAFEPTSIMPSELRLVPQSLSPLRPQLELHTTKQTHRKRTLEHSASLSPHALCTEADKSVPGCACPLECDAVCRLSDLVPSVFPTSGVSHTTPDRALTATNGSMDSLSSVITQPREDRARTRAGREERGATRRMRRQQIGVYAER